METTSYLALALLGGIAGLDAVSCIQAMISRPIVAAPVAGLLLGDPVAGMYVGVLLELVSLHQLPIGANRGWDTGPAAVVAAAVAAGQGSDAVALIVAAGLGAAVGWLGSWTVHVMRRATAALVANEDHRPMTPRSLSVRHLSALAVDFGRAAMLTLAGLLIAAGLASGRVAVTAQAASAAAAVALICVALAVGADIRTMARGRSVVIATGTGFLLSAMATLWFGWVSG